MTGGLPYYYDGFSLAELGFLLSPDDCAQATAGAGALTGTYSWCAIYETVDNEGNTHRSAPSAVMTDTLAAENGVITVPYLSLTARPNVVIKLYRTKASGSIFYEVTGKEEANIRNYSGGVGGVVGGVTITDNVADANLGEVLYTTGGEVVTCAPPSASCVAVHGERTWFGCGPRLYYSHQRVPAEAPTFSEDFYVQLPDDLKALASLDSSLAIFTTDAVYLLYGDGPDRIGQNSYQNPQRLTMECGCTNPRSVVVVPSGVMFRSERGIELLARGGAGVQFIGGPVQDGLAAYPDITGACVDHERSHVYFGCVDAEATPPTDGTILVYNYRWNRWTRWRTGTTTIKIDCLGMWSGGLTVARVDQTGNIFQLGTGYTDDAATWIQQRIRPGDIRGSGLMRYQRIERVNVLGEYKANHRLYLSVGYDGGITYPDSAVWNNATGTAGASMRWEYSPPQQKVEALRLSIYDAEDEGASGCSEGVSLHGISITVKPKRGVGRLPSGKRG
jgi:hypothetical protein